MKTEQNSFIEKAFTKQDINNLLVVDELDFIDKTTEIICKEKNLVLITNDVDFKKSDIDIITENKKILYYCGQIKVYIQKEKKVMV